NTQTRPTYRYEYNEQGHMTKLTDAMGRVTRFGLSALNQLETRTLPSGDQERFFYDARGRQSLQITFEGIYIRMIYDDSAIGGGRLREKQFFENADSYNNGTGSPSERFVIQYDAFGRVVEQQHLRGESTDTFTTRYDAQGRVIQETTPAGFIRYEYDALGRKNKVQSGVSIPVVLTEVTYTYDLLGKLSEVKTVVRDGMEVDGNGSDTGTPPESTRYFYDLLGRMDYAELPNAVVEDYLWDRMDRIDVMRYFRSDTDNTNLTDNILKSEFDYTYRADGQRANLVEKYGDMLPRSSGEAGWDEGVLTNRYVWQYDHAGRLTSEELDSSDNKIDQTETYLMDLVANRLRRTIDKPGTAEDSTDIYLYDDNDRLQSEDRYYGLTAKGTPIGDPIRSTTYGWHATQQTAKTVATPTVSKTTQAMSYGLGGQLEKVVTTILGSNDAVLERTRVDYRYDPQGIRFISLDWRDANLNGEFSAGERTGSVEYVIEHANHTGHQQTILETHKNADGQAIKRISYTFGLDEITQTTTTPREDGTQGWGEGETLTFGHDGRGSIKVLLGANAAIAQCLTYSAYGELIAIHNGLGVIEQPTSNMTTMLYNGEAYDMRTGLYNMRARWYSPTNARWERLDPFAGNPSDPFSYNKYGFVHGNPIAGTDPTGMYFSGSLGGLLGNMALMGSIGGGSIGAAMAIYAGQDPITAMGTIGTFAAAGALIAIRPDIAFYLIALIVAGTAFGYADEEAVQDIVPIPSYKKRIGSEYAELARAAYASESKDSVPGWNFLRKLDNNGRHGYHGRVYQKGNTIAIAFAGTDNPPDFVVDALQGMFGGTAQYDYAIEDAKKVVAENPNNEIIFVGHSLGGGLATSAAAVTGRNAVTFNAAGVHPHTVGRYGASLTGINYLVNAFRVKGEFLSTLQDASSVSGYVMPNGNGIRYNLPA
ncbi:MAG: hypothetical protein FJ308_20710, partial [Planctomycetes bacterium]|nr:hypothetical protein [Planctomycetota bacterium]